MSAGATGGPKWSDQLKEPALTIAGTNASPLRVAAGPGTGKTFALKRRVTRLLEQRANPQRILVVTFTRNAAQELTHEIQSLAVPAAFQVESSTLHSYCFKMLAKASVFRFTQRDARPLVEFEKRFLLDDLKIAKGRTFHDCARMIKAFEADWAELQDQAPGWPTDPTQQAFHQDMLGWLRFHKAMLLGELPSLALKFLKDNPTTQERQAFDHVLVDEYQDLNRADQDLIDLLSGSGSLTVIGDEDQSIYGSLRHAQPEGIREFANTHSRTQNETLDVCRRCPTEVISMANQLISANRGREQRTLLPMDPPKSGLVRIVQWTTIEQEAAGLAEFIQLYLDKNRDIDPGDILVLAPRRPHGNLIREELTKRDIPVVSYYFENAFKPQTIQERYTLLNLIVNEKDRVSLRCWLGFGHSSNAAIPYGKLRTYCEKSGDDVFDALDQLMKGTLKITRAQHLVGRWNLLKELRSSIGNLEGKALIDALFSTGETESEDFRLIADELQSSKGRDITAKELHEAITNRIINPEPPNAVGKVRIMSPYKAKGLTVKVAIMSGTIETWLPSLGFDIDTLTPVEQQRKIDEQRRLFYVSMTRPTDTLIISSFLQMPTSVMFRTLATARSSFRGVGSGLASRFISEMGRVAPASIQGNDLLAEMQ